MWRLAMPLLVLALAGCGGSGDEDASNERVVAAFYPLAWAAGEIADDSTEVVNLTPPGVEPHDVELSPRDVEALYDADFVVYLGGGFQPALERAVEERDGPSLDLLAGQALLEGEDEEGHDAPDPHVWLDPALFADLVGVIGRELGRDEAATELAARLRTLDSELERGMQTCERREIVTSHAAFAYLARRYGLEQVALSGLTPEAEPAPGDLVDLVEKVKASGATTVFFETLVPDDLARTVAREAAATTAVLDPLEGLTEAEVDAGEDYFSVMRANLEALRQALGCR
jgi:zinc transport system substrate-binding protein